MKITADIIVARAALAVIICDRLRQLGLSQAQSAKLLRTTQPRISDLHNAKACKMSFERLIKLARRSGLSVTLWPAVTGNLSGTVYVTHEKR